MNNQQDILTLSVNSDKATESYGIMEPPPPYQLIDPEDDQALPMVHKSLRKKLIYRRSGFIFSLVGMILCSFLALFVLSIRQCMPLSFQNPTVPDITTANGWTICFNTGLVMFIVWNKFRDDYGNKNGAFLIIFAAMCFSFPTYVFFRDLTKSVIVVGPIALTISYVVRAVLEYPDYRRKKEPSISIVYCPTSMKQQIVQEKETDSCRIAMPPETQVTSSQTHIGQKAGIE